MQRFQVTAVPISESGFAVECTQCGVIGYATSDEADDYCLEHLESHGVDTSKYRGK